MGKDKLNEKLFSIKHVCAIIGVSFTIITGASVTYVTVNMKADGAAVAAKSNTEAIKIHAEEQRRVNGENAAQLKQTSDNIEKYNRESRDYTMEKFFEVQLEQKKQLKLYYDAKVQITKNLANIEHMNKRLDGKTKDN